MKSPSWPLAPVRDGRYVGLRGCLDCEAMPAEPPVATFVVHEGSDLVRRWPNIWNGEFPQDVEHPLTAKPRSHGDQVPRGLQLHQPSSRHTIARISRLTSPPGHRGIDCESVRRVGGRDQEVRRISIDDGPVIKHTAVTATRISAHGLTQGCSCRSSDRRALLPTSLPYQARTRSREEPERAREAAPGSGGERGPPVPRPAN
jgi:hypothetical protein